MDARWMPLLAAAVGVLGGVGGALVGGSVANKGQEQGFQRERTAEIQDLRRQAYADFIGTAQELVGAWATGRSQAEQNAIFVRVIVAEARAALVTESEEVEKAAEAVRKSVTARPNDPDKTQEQEDREQLGDYNDAANGFLVVAREDIANAGG